MIKSREPFSPIRNQAGADRKGTSWRGILLALSLPVLIWLAADGAGAFDGDGDRPAAEAGDPGEERERETARESRGDRERGPRDAGGGQRDDERADGRREDGFPPREGRFGEGRSGDRRPGEAERPRDRERPGFGRPHPPHPEEMGRMLRELQEDVRLLRREVQQLREQRFPGPPHDRPGFARPRFGDRPEGDRPGFGDRPAGERPRDGAHGPREGDEPEGDRLPRPEDGEGGARPRDGERGPRDRGRSRFGNRPEGNRPEGERPASPAQPSDPEA